MPVTRALLQLCIFSATVALVACGAQPPATQAFPERAPSESRPLSGFSCLSSACIYVTNAERPPYAVTIYPVDARGREKPAERIQGPHTLLSAPVAIAVGSNHNVYVVSGGGYYTTVITVYAAGAYGDVAPVRTISVPDAKLGFAVGIAVDSSGNIYVANNGLGSNCTGSVTVYASVANGDVAPIAIIAGHKTGLCHPGGIAVGLNGNIYVTNGDQYTSSVTVYAANANGNVAPIQKITGRRTLLYGPQGVTLDSQEDIYATSGYVGTITKYRAGAHGNARPLQAIYGTLTKLQLNAGVAVDATDEIFATNQSENSVTVYASDANGDKPPIRTIKGTQSQLHRPRGIAVQ